ncbi:uroporphyrin-III C-methyltransferase [Bacillus ectoiniformans]|uniref:uroporphyrinogen-III C-methyltransferase n=1 Tax=Bacillus ectoiniformans TaxID=1494429 RepID=UPI0019562527|nr:uroporphyrinogen-III C-methyltransferase [Bacillus ectoiniformans]MBM7647820.1 uroporphyrin-III C-methyltransferase [Bacillus ectoiniformans]
MSGFVYIVGAGPGDPRLITVYGKECIEKADYVLYDRLINKELLRYAKPTAELVYCGKAPGAHGFIQDKIHETLVEQAKKGKTVVRLKGGDPFVFGRGAEEAAVLKQESIHYEVVPGITAGIAAPAYAGIPVTHRDHAASFAIVTGHGREEKGQDFLRWEALVQIDTVAFYMGIGNAGYISASLIAHGKAAHTPAAVIEQGTTEKQRTIVGTLESLADDIKRDSIQNPAMIIVGDVVNVRKEIKWYEQQRGGQYVKSV